MLSKCASVLHELQGRVIIISKICTSVWAEVECCESEVVQLVGRLAHIKSKNLPRYTSSSWMEPSNRRSRERKCRNSGFGVWEHVDCISGSLLWNSSKKSVSCVV